MWVRGYRRDWLGPDLVAGAVASCVVVPQAIAYASLAGLRCSDRPLAYRPASRCMARTLA